MARLGRGANSAPSQSSGQQIQTQNQISQHPPTAKQQYHAHPAVSNQTSTSENIDIINASPPRPPVLQQENSQNITEPPQIPDNGPQQNQKSSNYPRHQQTQSTGGMVSLSSPQSSQTNIASQAFQPSPENIQMRSFSSGHPTTQPQPQAFNTPRANNPQGFPPDHQLQFQSQQAFLPHVQPQAFPPPQAHVHAFPPPFSPALNSPHPTTHSKGGKHPTFQATETCPFIQPVIQLLSTFITGFPGVTQNPETEVQTEPWKTDLFACMDNPGNALVTAIFPCVTYGQVAEIVDNGQSPCLTSAVVYGLIQPTGMPWLLSCTNRSKLRARYGLMEYPAPDWMVHFFCGFCALCQEYRELQARGLDPSIGWHGNMVQTNNQKQQSSITPPTHQTMTSW